MEGGNLALRKEEVVAEMRGRAEDSEVVGFRCRDTSQSGKGLVVKSYDLGYSTSLSLSFLPISQW